jgi:hypothetical protein
MALPFKKLGRYIPGLRHEMLVDESDAKVFVSTEQTGNNNPQSVAHGLGVTPPLVLVVPTGVGAGGFDIAEGAHDATNVVVTVSAGTTYKVFAWA